MLHILEMAAKFEQQPAQKLLDGKIIASIFFEPSTRTRLSFETAANRLGARVVGFSDVKNTSVSKGETLKDTITMVANYADLIVMRHPLEGSARYASEIASVPVINAGDGANQHPSQTLLDLYSIQKTQGRLDDIHITMIGDLKYGRTVHSLLQALSLFNARFKFIAPPELQMPDEYKSYLTDRQLAFEEHSDLTGNIADADILYMTRVQRERFQDPIEYEKVKDSYSLKKTMLAGARPNMKILHPLPRVNEIDPDVDDTHHAYYFEQARNGMFVRMAIFAHVLGCA